MGVLEQTHRLHESLPGQQLVLPPLVFVLQSFLARGALEHYHTIGKVLVVRPPTNQSDWVFEWSDDVLDKPAFPEMTSCGFSEKI